MINLPDILFLIPMVWLGWKGFNKGLIVELSTLIALVLGIWIAMRFSHVTGDWLQNTLQFNSEYRHLVAFGLTFLVVVLAVNLLGRVVSKFAGLIMLSWLDKLAGTLFGILKAAFVISLVLYFINSLDRDEVFFTPESKESSYLYKPLEKLAPGLFPYLEREKLEEILPGETDLPDIQIMPA